ncbi:sigma-70 family RNA polymerase sigma factor [Tepidibacter formicigenes]|uniref:sigma-70 family RNA polymerase sigma factor n=1 Tax=Tepidibacter formicigenes TaxID=227138 RepID=UPI0038CD1CCA
MNILACTKSFPNPLTPKEELEYLKMFKDGDLKAKCILIERNLRLVAHIVKKYTNYQEELEDLISIGTIGLIKAIETYNIDKGTRLATYAARCIENEILMSIRAGKKNKGEVSLQDPIGVDKEGNEIS